MSDKYVTVAGAGTKAGTSWADAFGLSEFITDATNSAADGDNYWISGGTYAFPVKLQSTKSGLIRITGVKSSTTNEPPVLSDEADNTDRPLFTLSGSIFLYVGNYWAFKNIRIENSGSIDHKAGDGSSWYNCLIHSTGSATANFYVTGDNSSVINCDLLCNNGTALSITGSGVLVMNNYIHDSVQGIYTQSNSAPRILFNIIDTCATGIETYSYDTFIINNSIYNSTIGIHGRSTTDGHFLNNNIISCVTGIYFTTSGLYQQKVDYNNYYNNTTDVTNFTKGGNALAINPQFTDAANGDFSLNSASLLVNAGLGIELGVG